MNMPKEMGMSKEPSMSKEMRMSDGQVGHLYIQTNEIQNAIIHYHRSANGALSEVERCLTGGAGSGTFKPISGQESAPNAFEGAGSIILTSDRRVFFTTQGGRHSGFHSPLHANSPTLLRGCNPAGSPTARQELA